jgi:hypothetical protein
VSRWWVLGVCAALVGVAPAQAGQSFDGIYRTYLSMALLRAVGTPSDLAAADAGTWILSVANGHWKLQQRGGAFGSSTDTGDVVVTPTTALFTTRVVDGYPHHVEIGKLRWKRQGNGLRFSLTARQTEDLAGVLAARLWRRVR